MSFKALRTQDGKIFVDNLGRILKLSNVVSDQQYVVRDLNGNIFVDAQNRLLTIGSASSSGGFDITKGYKLTYDAESQIIVGGGVVGTYFPTHVEFVSMSSIPMMEFYGGYSTSYGEIGYRHWNWLVELSGDLDQITYIGPSAFEYQGLWNQQLRLNNCEYIATHAFAGMGQWNYYLSIAPSTTLIFPNVSYVETKAFEEAWIKNLWLNHCQAIAPHTLPNAADYIYLLSTNVVNISTTDSDKDPFCHDFEQDFDGIIYVPSELLSSYQSALGWSSYSSRFVAYVG